MNSEFQSLPPETQEAVKRTMDTMEPAQTPAEIRETLEGTQKGGVKNSIRNCLTVFQRDPLFRGALRLNLLTEQIDIVKPLGWERTSTTLTDMDMNYLLLYLEENYGLISEKKVQSAIKIVANENRYHPVRDYLNSLQWDGTERIRYALHHFLGADTDEYTYEALKLFLMEPSGGYSDRGASLRSCSVWLVVREPGNLPFSGCWQAGTNGFQTI